MGNESAPGDTTATKEPPRTPWWQRLGWLALAALALAAIVLFVVSSEDRDTTGTAVLRIVLDWPVIGGVLLLAAGVRFHFQIEQFLQKLAWFKAGPVEASTRVQPPPPSSAPPSPAEPSPPESVAEPVAGPQPEAKPESGPARHTEEQYEQAVQSSRTWENQAWFWWCEFLSAFLVPKTQFMLLWFASSAALPPSKDTYHVFWSSTIPNFLERETMLSALRRFELVTREDTGITVSDGGRRFIAHMDVQHVGWRDAAARSIGPFPTISNPPPPSTAVVDAIRAAGLTLPT